MDFVTDTKSLIRAPDPLALSWIGHCDSTWFNWFASFYYFWIFWFEL